MLNCIRKLVFVFVSVFLLSSCQNLAGAQLITPQGDKINLEFAITEAQKTQGLMNRTSLPPDSGMLFVFDTPRVLSFWMKNTLIPLDVVFIDEQKKLVDVQTMDPCPKDAQKCPSYLSKGMALYALEINGGKAADLKLKVGDELRFNLPKND